MTGLACAVYTDPRLPLAPERKTTPPPLYHHRLITVRNQNTLSTVPTDDVGKNLSVGDGPVWSHYGEPSGV
jgi:hypothetical protein